MSETRWYKVGVSFPDNGPDRLNISLRIVGINGVSTEYVSIERLTRTSKLIDKWIELLYIGNVSISM